MISNVQFNFSHEPGLRRYIGQSESSLRSVVEWFINVPILSIILSFASRILSLVTKDIMKLNYDYEVLSLFIPTKLIFNLKPQIQWEIFIILILFFHSRLRQSQTRTELYKQLVFKSFVIPAESPLVCKRYFPHYSDSSWWVIDEPYWLFDYRDMMKVEEILMCWLLILSWLIQLSMKHNRGTTA